MAEQTWKPNEEPKLLRPLCIPEEVHSILEDCDEEEISEYLLSGRCKGKDEDTEKMTALYRKKRREQHDLNQKLKVGEANVDEDGRLVAQDQSQTQGNALPVVPPMAAAAGNQNRRLPLPPPPQPLAAVEEEDRQWFQREERRAAEEIALAMRAYVERGVDLEEIELVPVAEHHAVHNNLTFRRIFCAVMAVAVAFVCIMMQTLPITETVQEFGSVDRLMDLVLQMKVVESEDSLHRLLNQSRTPKSFNGVLHIPPVFKIGSVNASWFFPCHDVHTRTLVPKAVSSESSTDTCPTFNRSICFRGVHDQLFSYKEITDIVRFGSSLITLGGDHFDIYLDIPRLEEAVPSVISKLRQLLYESYHVNLQPVAFRIVAFAPMDGDGVPLYGIAAAAHPVARLLNRTNYMRWVQKSMQHNEAVANQFSLWNLLSWVWSSPASQARRDTCNLMADMEVDERFEVLTSVSLTVGAGRDYQGGATVFVDDEFLSRRVRRGLSVDGSRGRVLVSTGGLENRRCRFPMTTGVQANLQIWWN